jgi:hypothetical protein
MLAALYLIGTAGVVLLFDYLQFKQFNKKND